jgi:nicotinamide-nucleotide amidase
MHIELLTIGDELLDGLTVDGNAARVGRALDPFGLRVARRVTVRDRLEDVAEAFRDIAARADLCITSGGLGPTTDDLTVDGLALASGAALVEDAEVWARILARYDGRAPTQNNRRQTRIPAGGRALMSDVGTAPAIEFTWGRCTFFLLPGVPREFQWHLESHVLPALHARVVDAPIMRSRRLHFVGIGESALGARIERLDLPAGLQIAYRAHDLALEVRLRGLDESALDAAATAVSQCGEEAFVGAGETGLIEAVLAQCEARGLSIGFAESCTGGLVGALVTDVPGASRVFRGSIVAYANDVKARVLGVPEAVLGTEGAVSEACAEAMARGAARVLGVDIGIAVTGIAGPDGGTPQKPVGTVCIAWSGAGLDRVTTVHLRGDRDRIRTQAAVRALDTLRRGLAR